MKSQKRVYDHRLKHAIARTGNINLFPELKIPKTTAKNWIRRGICDVVSVEAFDLDREKLELKCIELENQVIALKATSELIKVVAVLLGLTLQYQRFSGDVKKKIVDAIEKAKLVLPLNSCLEAVGLSKQRFANWLSRMKTCQLEDFSSCPKTHITRLMPKETSAIGRLVKDPTFSHFSLTSLWLHARNTNEVIVSLSSWFRTIRDLKLNREDRKKYYCEPKSGYRATSPNQSWHIDVSVLRFNGLRAYVQAVRDNFSRMILAYKVSLTYGGEETKALLEAAVKKAQEFGYFNVPEVIADQGTENVNSYVHDLDSRSFIKLVLAQIDIHFSNSMIESFFHQLKNRVLYYKDIHTLEVLTGHIDFYVKEHNEVIPFFALGGSTPIQAYRSAQAVMVNKEKDKEIAKAAVQRRIKFHQSLSCRVC
jgi:putative transposase